MVILTGLSGALGIDGPGIDVPGGFERGVFEYARLVADVEKVVVSL